MLGVILAISTVPNTGRMWSLSSEA